MNSIFRPPFSVSKTDSTPVSMDFLWATKKNIASSKAMSHRTKRSTGCWTCRARRKRCDSKIPHCETCRRLGITCAGYASDRPKWMDGGSAQQEFCRKLTASIRQRNKTRNDTDLMSNSSTSIDESLPSWNELDTQYLSVFNYADLNLDTAEANSSVYSDLGWFPDPHMNWSPELENTTIQLVESPMEKEFSFPATEVPLAILAPPEESHHPSHVGENEDFLIMRYFDHTFYYIFPYHCWQAQEAHRGWLLSHSRLSNAFRPALLSTVSFQYDEHCSFDSSLTPSLAPENGWSHWQTYYRQALTEIENNMSEIQGNNSLTQQAKLRLSMEGLAGIVHLTGLANLGAHIDGFEQILENGFKLIDMLTQIRSEIDQTNERSESTEKPKVNLPDAFTYVDVQLFDLFSSSVIRHYVLFCASIPNPPTHRPQIDRLLDGNKLDMKPLCGCSRQVLKAIVQVTELRLWKQDAIHNGRLSVLELARRACIVEERLREELKTLQSNTTVHRGMTSCVMKRLSHEVIPKPCPLHECLSLESAKILGFAALIYLHAVVSGPNPNLPEIDENLTLCRKGLRTVGELQIRPVDLIWPVCVMGCMVREREDLSQEIHDYFSGMDALKQLSLAGKMLKRIGEAWQIRDTSPVSEWAGLVKHLK